MKYPAYPRMRPVSAGPLAQVPEHWSVRRLRFLTLGIEQGWSPQCDNQPADDEGWGVMKVGCVNGNGFDASENKALPPELAPLAEYELKPGDVLVSRANTRDLVGSAALVPQGVRPRLLLCDKLFRLQPERGLRPDFLVYYLRTPAARFHYERDATGASGSMQSIGQDTIKDLVAVLPDESEQERIVRFLDWKIGQIDALIAKKQSLVVNLSEQRLSSIAEYVKGEHLQKVDRRSTDIAWLARIPAHWQVIPLGFLVEMSGGLTPSLDEAAYWEGTIPWVSPKDMKRPRIGDSIDHVSSLAIEETGLSLKSVGSVLIVVRGMILAHSFPTAITMKPVTINQDMKALQCSQQLDPEYLFWCLTGFGSVLCNFADESAHGTRKMETETLKKFALPVPPVEEQRAIAAVLGKAIAQLDSMAEQTRETISRLTEYRSALITAAVTGQIDVRAVKVAQTA